MHSVCADKKQRYVRSCSYVLDLLAAWYLAMANYFIKSAGTAEEPLQSNWYAGGAAWRDRHANATMFPQRPRVAKGDRLVYYAVGSAGLHKKPRIFAVVEVTSEPEPSGHPRWKWQVQTRMLVPGPRLLSCPTLDDIDVRQTSLRQASHITLTEHQGKNAERLIALAAERAGSVGHCYNGPPGPDNFEPGA
jgi:hypothetical protein